MKRVVIKELSDIEIEEILANHFDAFDALLKIIDTEEGQIVCAEIVNYEINKRISIPPKGGNVAQKD